MDGLAGDGPVLAPIRQGVHRFFELVAEAMAAAATTSPGGGGGDGQQQQQQHAIAIEVIGEGGGLWVLRSAAGVHSMAKLDNAPGAPLPEEAFSCRVQTSLETMAEIASGATSRRRGCHFADTPSPSLLKYLLKGQGAAAE